MHSAGVGALAESWERGLSHPTGTPASDELSDELAAVVVAAAADAGAARGAGQGTGRGSGSGSGPAGGEASGGWVRAIKACWIAVFSASSVTTAPPPGAALRREPPPDDPAARPAPGEGPFALPAAPSADGKPADPPRASHSETGVAGLQSVPASPRGGQRFGGGRSRDQKV